MITASAPTFGALFLGSSIVEALGAALVVPATMALVAANYEGRDRALAFGIVGGAAGAGAAGGPIIGGRVTTTHTWRVVFAAEVVIVLGILACTKVTADGPRKPVTGHLDLMGTLLSPVGFGVIVIALVESSSWGGVRPLDPALLRVVQLQSSLSRLAVQQFARAVGALTGPR